MKSQKTGLAFLIRQGASLSMHQPMPRSMQQTSVSRLMLLASLALFQPGPVQGQSSKYLQYQCNPSARECARRMLDVRGEPLLMAEERVSAHARVALLTLAATLSSTTYEYTAFLSIVGCRFESKQCCARFVLTYKRCVPLDSGGNVNMRCHIRQACVVEPLRSLQRLCPTWQEVALLGYNMTLIRCRE